VESGNHINHNDYRAATDIDLAITNGNVIRMSGTIHKEALMFVFGNLPNIEVTAPFWTEQLFGSDGRGITGHARLVDRVNLRVQTL
jgi:hypothetical protein